MSKKLSTYKTKKCKQESLTFFLTTRVFCHSKSLLVCRINLLSSIFQVSWSMLIKKVAGKVKTSYKGRLLLLKKFHQPSLKASFLKKIVSRLFKNYLIIHFESPAGTEKLVNCRLSCLTSTFSNLPIKVYGGKKEKTAICNNIINMVFRCKKMPCHQVCEALKFEF